MSNHSNIDILKRFLFQLPLENDFQMSAKVRAAIRKHALMALTNHGDYLDWMFPQTLGSKHDDNDNATDQIGKQFDWLFANYYKAKLQSNHSTVNTHNHRAFHYNLPCARIFRQGEPIYRCLTCGYDDTCALCSNCYQEEHHQGHKVHITICLRENGGVCDCGDPEAWVEDFHCPYSIKDDNYMNLGNQDMPVDFQHSFLCTIQTLLDFVIDVMSHSDLQFIPINELNKELIEYYSLNSSLDSQKYGFVSSEGVSDTNSEKYYLMVYNDQLRHYRDAVQRVRLASGKVKQFAIMVTERAQTYGKARVLSSSDISLLKERQKILSSTGLATCIRSHRDIFREDMCDEILLWINDLTGSEIFKINNTTKNLFCQAFCGRWNNGLSFDPKIHSLLNYNTGRLDYFNKIPKVVADKSNSERNPASHHWSFDPTLWNLPSDLCQQCDYNLNVNDYHPQKSHLGSRIQYFIYLDIRFWKSIRSLMHDMYSTSLITNLRYKQIISAQYVDLYPSVADMFLTMDREPELNIMGTFSTQLFTCPSNSTSIVKHGDLSRIFASIYGFLTVQQIKSPQNLEVTHEISMKSLKSRRWGQIFFDIGYILSRSTDSKSILTEKVIGMACDILALFQGRPVLKRESKNHVEYESPDYTAFFHAILVIYQFGEFIANCLNNFEDLGKSEVQSIGKNAISYVYKFLLALENSDYPGIHNDSLDIDTTSNKEYIMEPQEQNLILKYRIDRDKVSFLHPIHCFLSWLIELSGFHSITQLDDTLKEAAFHYEAQLRQLQLDKQLIPAEQSPITTIFEYPIRTIVLMSQIRSGFWVRNGFSVRSQLQLYKSTSLRESGYMRDIFFVQVFSNLASPNLVCFTIFNRWLLMDGWINSISSSTKSKTANTIEDAVDDSLTLEDSQNNEDSSSYDTGLAYDQKILPYMVEECLNFFIHLLTEDIFLRGLRDDIIVGKRIEKEIIHNLCFGPMSYTKLCSLIPDHISAEKRFDIILQEMTIFSPPNISKDIGTYKLKDEFFDKINPYYFNYSANTKEDAVKSVKNHIKSKMKDDSDVVIVPNLENIHELGIYKYIGNFSTSTYFRDFIIKTFLYVNEKGSEKCDSIIETLLHLLHICAFENLIDIEKYGTFYGKVTEKSDKFNVSIAECLYKFLINESFKPQHAKIKAIFEVFDRNYNVIKNLFETISDFDESKLSYNTEVDNKESEFDRKKRIAKNKQAKLLSKFKKQQSLFFKNNNMVDTEDHDHVMDCGGENGWNFPEPHCLLCQNTSEDAGPFGIITHVSKSSEFRTVPFSDKYWFLKAFSDSSNLDEDDYEKNSNIYSDNWKAYMKSVKDRNVIGPGFNHLENVESKLVSLSCGHGMHFQCYINFLNNNRSKLNQITRNSPENIEHKEFLCPLCKAINNMFIPILWSNNVRSLKGFLDPGELDQGNLSSFNSLQEFESRRDVWFNNFVDKVNNDIESFSCLTPDAIEIIGQTSSSANANTAQQYFKLVLSNMFQVMSLFSFPYIYKADSANVLINSICSTEISLRGLPSELTVIDQLSNNHLVNLRCLNEFRNTTLLMKTRNWIQNPSQKYDIYVKLLSNLMGLSSDSFNQKVLEQDFFELLVNAFPIPSAGFLFNVILKACFTGHVIQSLFNICSQIIQHDFYQCSEYSILDLPIISTLDDKVNIAADVFKKVRMTIDNNPDEVMIMNDSNFGLIIYTMLIKACTPFLRRAAIYAFVSCAEVDDIDFHGHKEIFLEADKLCSLMNIDPLYHILDKFLSLDNSSFENQKFNGFLNYYKQYGKSPSSQELLVQVGYPGLIKLIDLPERLDYFFTNYYYLDNYNNPHTSMSVPAICLFCGEVVDAQKQAVGSDIGQCTTHFLKECPNSVGIFLLPKEKCILLLHKNGGSFIESPYLDQHGELPGDSKRSKTLYLMKPKYDKFIRNIWLNHNIPNYIVRKLDSVIDAGGWDTL